MKSGSLPRGTNIDDIPISTPSAPLDPVHAAAAGYEKKGVNYANVHNNEAAALRELLMSSASRTMFRRFAEPGPNPLWMNFPTPCVENIRSVQHMRQLLEYHSHSNDVMIVRYAQHGCTACNAIDKITDYLCHEKKKHMPNLNFYSVQKEDFPELVEGMVRFPQVKAFNQGQWADMDFKPPQDFRETMYQQVAKEVKKQAAEGTPVSAIQAEEMYFSASAPASTIILSEAITCFYAQAQARLHNYFKQVSVRRTWFFRKYIEPMGEPGDAQKYEKFSVLGELVAKPEGEEKAAPTTRYPSGNPGQAFPSTMLFRDRRSEE